jgi:hypothetical protein
MQRRKISNGFFCEVAPFDQRKPDPPLHPAASKDENGIRVAIFPRKSLEFDGLRTGAAQKWL